MMNTTELLSPSGSFDCAISAFTYGADAIYLGLNNFSARADAINFTEEELEKITSIAHSNNKKVYVAINTVIQNNELPELIEKLSLIERLKVDGVILQDFALVNLIKKYFPKISMHASTQMAVHNLEGAKILKDMGFKRVVLARELSFNEIENITKNCGIETEVFIHGALCYSYSGLCLYSSFERGESANRGKCTYPCRKLHNGNHPFAMKDLSLNEYILKLAKIGVASLKIEGRKKTPLYVAATTDYYRKILDGKNTKGCLDNIKRIFARPYTILHFNGKNKDVIYKDFCGPQGLLIGKVERLKRNVITFKTSYPIEKHDGLSIQIKGIEKPYGFAIDKMWVNEKPSFIAQKGDKVEIALPKDMPEIPLESEVYCTSSQIVKQSYPYKLSSFSQDIEKPLIDITFKMTKDNISVSSNNVIVERKGEFAPTTNPIKMAEGAKTAFSKLGESSFNLGEFIYLNEGFFAPLSLLNDIRREFVDKLNKLTLEKQLPQIEYIKNDIKTLIPSYIVKVDNPEYLSQFTKEDFEKVSEVIIDIFSDITKLNSNIPSEKIRISIPVINRNAQLPNLKSKISEFITKGFKKFMVSNISGIYLMKEFSISDWVSDFYLYTLNDFSADFILSQGSKRITLSPEDSKENMQSILQNFNDKTDIIIYSDIPLFISDNCLGDCKNCKSTDNIIIRNCRHYVLGKSPYCIANKQNELTPKHFRIDFCYKSYKADEVRNIFHNLVNKQCPKNSTSANFEKGFK